MTSANVIEASRKSVITRVVSIFISLAGTLIVMFPINPVNVTVPSRDSGVFLYVGWRVISGDIPYLDVWDHKPPLIYFVDALGLLLTRDSLWGVWLLQFGFIFFTLFVIYKLLDREFGTYAALAGAISLPFGLVTILDRGNVTEEYALLFQALALWLIARAWKKDFPLRDSFWIGISGGLAFYFKQTTIGIWIAYGVVLLTVRLLQRKWPLRDFASLLAGVLVPSTIIALYFASQNALMPYWEQAFAYNFVYIGKHEGVSRFSPVFIKGYQYLQNGGLIYLAALGWILGLVHIWSHRKAVLEVNPLVLMAVVTLPFEVIFLILSGRSIVHYYLTPLPIIGILVGVTVYLIPRLIKQPEQTAFHKSLPSLLLLAVGLLQVPVIRSYPLHIRDLAPDSYAPVVDYVVENTDPDDKVLIIGAESAVNFLARREAPTRYVYQYPLALLGRREMFEEYFDEILGDPPTLIIDTRGRARLDEKLYEPIQKRSEIVSAGVKYLGENYEAVAHFGEWTVYRFKGSDQ